MPDELTALQVKLDMLHDELRRFETDFKKDFSDHKHDDKQAFSEISKSMQHSEQRLTKIETRIMVTIGVASVIIGPLVSYLIKLMSD